MNRSWIASLIRHCVIALAGLVIGSLYGQAAIGLIIALVGLLAWHLYNLNLLGYWLESGKLQEMPTGNGIWARIFARFKFIEKKSRENSKKYRRLVKELRAATKAFPDGGVILNMGNEIVACNKVACQLLGLKRKRDRGQRIDNFIRNPLFVNFLEQGTSRETVEMPAPQSDRWLSCRLMPYGLDQRLLLVSDISQAKKLETTRSDFVANASHELRSPLTVLMGYLDAMAEDEQTPQSWRQPIADMCEQTERMSQLVADLLQLSKLESSATSRMDQSIDVVSILNSARKDALAADRHPQDIELDLQTDAQLLGEETEIQSIVSNLVSNAVRYTPEDGKITISWSMDDKGGHLAVEDNGIGIAQEDIPRLTERFFRADGGRARQKGGTGLGLAIVKYALKRHDAELEISSEPGRGSRFTCHFAPQRLADSSVNQEKATG